MNSLNEKINIVLNEEKRAYSANGRRGGGLGSFNIGLETEWVKESEIPKLISDSPSLDILQSDNAKLLLKLYYSLSAKEKQELQSILLSNLSKDSTYFDVAYFVFFVLHRIGKTVEAITQARQHLKGDSNMGFSNMLGMLKNIVKYEHAFITSNLLEQIKKSMDGESEHNFQLFERINSALLKNLSMELESNNQEINEDKEKLRIEFKKYNFPQDLADTLDKIDQKLNSAHDNFDFKGCMDLIRSFTERLYQTIAIALDGTEGKKMNEKDSEETAKFFKERNLISDDQGKILSSLRHFLSNFGSHRLKSRPEDARLSRNMAIEFALYLLRRFEEIK